MYFNRFVFEPSALKTEYGKQIFETLTSKGLKPEEKLTKEECGTTFEKYMAGKRTLIIGTRNPSKFQSCRPSANYQLPILSGCPSMCEYCYLVTRMGENAYVKLNANIVKVFTIVQDYINQSPDETISFELSASSDPLPFEEPTGVVSKTIKYFGSLTNGRLRICTKFSPDISILTANHEGHTDIRFSMNSEFVVKKFEHATPNLEKRIEAAKAAIKAGYPVGIMIAPVFVYDGWENDYKNLLDKLVEEIGDAIKTFEVVTHRYTERAKGTIINIFPKTELDMKNETRNFRMGQFGYGKYIYDRETLKKVKEFFSDEIASRFKSSKLLYVVSLTVPSPIIQNIYFV